MDYEQVKNDLFTLNLTNKSKISIMNKVRNWGQDEQLHESAQAYGKEIEIKAALKEILQDWLKYVDGKNEGERLMLYHGAL